MSLKSVRILQSLPPTFKVSGRVPILKFFPAVNAVAGRETRAEKYMHWWTFLGYFMEIREGVFATVVRIRTKKLEGKTLDKWEKEFYQKNKKICDLIVEKTEQEKQEEQEINNLLG